VPPAPLPAPLAQPVRRSFLELLLDPRSIHWLLGSGGFLLAAGLVVWLASLGLFQNPLVVSLAMGVGTVGLLAAGWGVIRFSRYQLAGRAITLLACLVMPLNLWFYNAHDLVTLQGHLWLAGVVCCALYAASAWFLEDALFVYVLNAGVAMTGLLMLADMHHFAQIASPATLLVVLGLIALHVERIFPASQQGAFTREHFGKAFVRSAQALIGSGLVLLLAAQLVGLMTLPFVHFPKPQIVTDPGLKWLALGLVAAGTYATVYSSRVARRGGAWFYVIANVSAVATVINLVGLPATASTTAFTLLLAGLGLTMLSVVRFTRGGDDSNQGTLRIVTRRCGNALTMLSFISAALVTLSHLMFQAPQVAAVVHLGALAGLSLLAATLAGHSGWRRGYVTTTVVLAALAGIALERLMHLSTWQNIEIFAVAAGVALLLVGYAGWYREQTRAGGTRRNDDSVGVLLSLGSVLAGVPLAIAAIVARTFTPDISLANEFALVTVGLALLVSGYICRIRSTTLTGGGLLACQLMMMLVFLGVRAQLALGVYLTLGGAGIFISGLLLSIYRDRLATLPQRIRDRQGMFQILNWR
jgi:hypothetical protein